MSKYICPVFFPLMIQAYTNKNDYMLIHDQKPMSLIKDDISVTTTLFSDIQQDNPIKRRSSFVASSTRLCRRIGGSIRRNIHDTLQSNRESKREKRPQDGKTNPME